MSLVVEKSAVAGSVNSATSHRRGGLRRSHGRAALWLIGPFMLFYGFVYAAPIVYSLVQSVLSRRNTTSLGFGGIQTVFVGFGNYAIVLADGQFWAGMGRILVLGLVQVPVMLAVAVALALLIDSKVPKGARFFRLVYFLPFAVPGVIAGVLWSYLYGPTLSPIVKGFAASGIAVDFLGRDTVLWSIANIILWSFTGYNMLIALSALQAIPAELYEAARIDGANEWQIATQIKIPHLRPALVLSGTLSIIGTIQTFNEPQTLSVVSPFITSQYVPTMSALNAAFGANNFGLAAATSIVLAVIAGITSTVYYRITSARS